MIRYPENSEHEYISWLIYCERIHQEETLVEPIRDRYWEAYCTGDRDMAQQLWNEANQTLIQIVEQMRRKEDMVYWLYLDQELRQEGKTYPDVYERSGWSQCVHSERF